MVVFIPACLDTSDHHIEDETLLPQDFSDKDAYYPQPFIDNSDSYPQILVNDSAAAALEEISDSCKQMSKSGLGSELLSQTDSDSEIIDLDISEVNDIEIKASKLGNENKIGADVKTDTTSDNVNAKQYSDFCHGIPYIDSASVIMSQLNLGQESQGRMTGEGLVNEEDLIEYEDVNINPDFDEAISLSTSNSDIDQNNQNTRQVQFRDHIQNLAANKNQNEITDMSHDLACILDDLDTHLNQNQSLDSCLESPNKGNWESPDSFQPKYSDFMGKNMANLSDTEEKRDSFPQSAQFSEAVAGCTKGMMTFIPNDQTGLIGEHKTPQFKGVFSDAIDSIYVTKKRTLHDAEIASVKAPEITPLRPSHFDHVGRSAESEADINSHSRKATRKSVSFSPIHQPSVIAKPEKNLPKQGLSALPSSSPKTYFASLEKSGHLSPFIKSIASKYGLFHSTLTSNNVQQTDNLVELDLDLDESYASTLLGRSGELEDSAYDNSFSENTGVDEKIKEQEEIGSRQLENLEETAATNTGKVESMINKYLYDVFECVSDESHSSPENEIMNKSVNRLVNKVISESCTAVEAELISSQDRDKNSSRSLVIDHEPHSDSQDHDSELSDLEFYSDSVLLCITHGSDEDSPPLSNCSPSLYPSRIETALPDVSGSPCKKPNSTVVIHKENGFSQFTGKPYQVEEDEIRKFKPVERPPISNNFLLNNNKDDEDGILSYMMPTSTFDSKLPGSRNVLQTSSFCHIPFAENCTPSFWFKKDTRESPKEKKTWQPERERKAKSPGKRSFSVFYETSSEEKVYQVPSLTKLAEKVHLTFFKQRLDAIGRSLNSIIGKRINSEAADKSASYPGILERSPAKKRRKQDMKPYHRVIETNNSALSPTEEGSVEIYFTSFLDPASDEDNFFVSSCVSLGSQDPLKPQSESKHKSKIDWSKALFGSKSHIQKYTGGSPYPAECPFVTDGKPFVREVPESHTTYSPFVSPFKSDRHFRHRPVQSNGSSPFVDDLSEKRKKRKFRPKVNINKATEPVTLTSFCSLNNKSSHDFCAVGKTSNEMREKGRHHTTAASHKNDDSLCLDAFEKCSYQNFICPGKYCLDSSEVKDQNDEQKPVLPDVSRGMFDSSIGSGAFRSFTDGNISTKTIYSENDLCNFSDLSENLPFQQEKLRQESSHTEEVYGNMKVHKNFLSDNASSLSMFYNAGTDEFDESLSEISQNDVVPCDKDLCSTLQSPEKACSISQNPDKDVIGIDDTTKKVQMAECSLNCSVVVSSHSEVMASDQTNVSKKIEAVEEAVRNHLDTSNDSKDNVLNIMKTRGALYEAIGSAVESFSDAFEERNSAAVEACHFRVANDEEGSENETKNDWEITPDPDTLLRDLENIDLSDTPQYVNKNTDEEMKQFLDNVLQPFDDILTDSFNSVSESPIHRTSTKDEEIDEGMHVLCGAESEDLMNANEDSFNLLNESPICSTNTKGVEEFDESSGLCEATAVEDLINKADSVLNRSFIEDEKSTDTSAGTPVKFSHQNTSSTPITDAFSPSEEPVSPKENKLDELIKFSDTEDESFVSAMSSRPKQCDNSKNTSDSFESYQTGIDRSSILGWSEEDTINANSDLESFFQSLSESSTEKTCTGQEELTNRIKNPLTPDLKFHTDYGQPKETYKGGKLDELSESGAGDCLVDMESIQLNLQDDCEKSENTQLNLHDDYGMSLENHCSVDEGSANNYSFQAFMTSNAHQTYLTNHAISRNAHQAFMTDNVHHAFMTNNAHPGLLRIDENTVLSENLHAAMPYFDGYSPEKVSSSETKDGSLDSKPPCFYVGSSQESGDSSSEVEL